MNADLDRHLTSSFALTGAIRPAPKAVLKPREGFRVTEFRDPSRKLTLPLLTAAVSAERLFDAFLALLEPLGETLHVILESSHESLFPEHRDYRRNHIDAPVLKSHFCDYEELLLNDGCAGIAVISTAGPMEVQFDEHKILCVYALDLAPFKSALRDLGLRRRKDLPLISEVEHMHHSTDAWQSQFEELAMKLGVGEEVCSV